MRMKQIQRIMAAIRTHENITRKQKEIGKKAANDLSTKWTKKAIINKTNMLRGRISSSRRKTRDLWLTRKRPT